MVLKSIVQPDIWHGLTCTKFSNTMSAVRSLDFQKADFSKISGMIASVKWAEILESCSKDDIPELFTETLLQVCQAGCPRKVPPKNKSSSSVRIPSRRKRKLQVQLNEAVNNPYSPLTHIESLKRKLALAHIDIRDAINQDLLYREQQAVSKVKENPKYFYSYAKKFSKKKKTTSAYYTTKMSTLSQIPRILPISYKISSCLSLVIPQKLTLMLHQFPPPEINHPFTDDILDFEVSDIIKAIEDIKPNAAPGPDDIKPNAAPGTCNASQELQRRCSRAYPFNLENVLF